jgi:hypothetical protein
MDICTAKCLQMRANRYRHCVVHAPKMVVLVDQHAVHAVMSAILRNRKLHMGLQPPSLGD